MQILHKLNNRALRKLMLLFRSCRLVGDYERFGETFHLHLRRSSEDDTFFPNVGNHLWLYGIWTHETTSSVFTAVRTSDVRLLWLIMQVDKLATPRMLYALLLGNCELRKTAEVFTPTETQIAIKISFHAIKTKNKNSNLIPSDACPLCSWYKCRPYHHQV